MSELEDRRREKVVLNVARRVLGLETLEARYSDELDFPELAVWQVRWALREAYEAGWAAGLRLGRDKSGEPRPRARCRLQRPEPRDSLIRRAALRALGFVRAEPVAKSSASESSGSSRSSSADQAKTRRKK